MKPRWLTELRQLLAIPGASTRQAALQAWEERWLVECECYRRLSEAEIIASDERWPADIYDHLLSALGRDLAQTMGYLTCEVLPDSHLTSVRAWAMAIRASPLKGPEDDGEAKVPGVLHP